MIRVSLLLVCILVALVGCKGSPEAKRKPPLSAESMPGSIRILEKCLSKVNDPYAAAECRAKFRDVHSKKDLFVLAKEYNRFVEAVSKDGRAGPYVDYQEQMLGGAAPEDVVSNFYASIRAICSVDLVSIYPSSGYGQDVVACETQLLKNALHQFHR